MQRRQFVAASAAALASPHELASAGPADAAGRGRPLLLELRRYRLRTGAMSARFGAYVANTLVPALGRVGVAPVGAWNVQLGAESPTLHLLLPHPDAHSLASLGDRLSEDAAYRKGAAELVALPSSDPPFVRCDSSLHAAVPTFPGVALPSGPSAGKGRVFELRTYRSHSEPASLRKIDMFEDKGELRIFSRLGLDVVFFARDLVGSALPSLTYMLVFADGAAREKAWASFGADPEWQKLRALPGYADPEIVSGISSALLRPAEGSQL
jgi:hypothetical protein